MSRENIIYLGCYLLRQNVLIVENEKGLKYAWKNMGLKSLYS
jgi:hypothetical protein